MNYGGGYEAYGSDDFNGGGGGFVSSQGGGGGGGSQGTPSKQRGGSRDAQTIVPVTVRQLQSVTSSDEDGMRLDGQEVTTVRLVGLLTGLTPHSTNVRFQLDDGTGSFDCQYFLHADDADFAESELAKLREGSYVRTVGKLRTFQDKVSLSSFSVTPVEDFNELTHHFLDAIYVHCYHTKGPQQGAGGDTTMTGAFATPTKAAAQPWNQVGNAGTTGYGAQTGSMDYGMMDSNFSPEQKAILDVLGTCTSDRGLKIDQIFSDLRGQLNEAQLRSALDYLTSEGHVYSTIDENHFKRTT